MAVLTDTELPDCVRAMMTETRLQTLLVAICSRPNMRAAAEAVSVNYHADAVEIAACRPDGTRPVKAAGRGR